MSGKIKTTSELKRALILRNGGYSVTAIATRTGISASTLARHFKKLGAVKGGLTDDSVIEARQQLLNDAGFMSELKHQIAAVIVDDLAHVVQLREAMALTLEAMMMDNALPAHYKTRGIAALATTLRLTQEAARKALSIDNQPIEQESLPQLIINELGTADIEQMRREQRELELETSAGIIYDDDVIETVD